MSIRVTAWLLSEESGSGEDDDALVVGGGPTGLVLALALHKHGCPDVVTVDTVAQDENTSRAVTIHPATIEAFQEVGGADPLVNAAGNKLPKIPDRHMHITERALAVQAQERGITVHRPHKVVDLKLNAEDHTLTDVIFDNGHVLRTRFIVGVDGSPLNYSQTPLSGQADMKNKDEAALSNMFVADILLFNPPAFPQDSTRWVFHPMCRTPSNPRAEIAETLWASRFRTHSAIADRFFAYVLPGEDPSGLEGSSVVLHGDAAHVHPPMGVQGMNLGIRDGVRLTPLLTAYIRAASASSASSMTSRD
ncbi:hypothetical protein C8Q74DRAFT_1362825 [Fomes fomentarius]|nr:hypothetical protein C8Q74DRAFT_1362825 [Fomes fomentarius]